MAKVRSAEVLSVSSFRPESLRGRAGFFRVGRTVAGQWWLLDSHDRPVFIKAVAAVNRHGRAVSSPGQRGAYLEAVERVYGYGDSTGFASAALRRLRNWHVNTLGPWAEVGLTGCGLNSTEVVDFRGTGVPVIHSSGIHLPDVFGPDWVGACETRAAEVAATWAGRKEFVGYYTDEALGWGEARADRPSLLQVCLSLEPAFSAYHAAWEFVLSPHGGELSALAREWSIDLPNREVIRQRTRDDRSLATAGYLRDDERFAREFARRYFTTTSAALRRHDPDHLILGCRFAQPPGAAVLAECVYPQVDVLSWSCHEPEFAVQVGRYANTAGMPLLLTSVGLANERFCTAAVAPRSGPTRIERMLRDGRRALTAACVHPSMVGYEWARWADESDEVPPFGAGLVHVDDREAVEHTELVAQINARAERVRRRSRESRV
ncbi:MAG: hypothetical protein WC205_16100 [Opitutaceae bacterium]|jgi:hypothetical protein